MPYTAFRLFSSLPSELRLTIWQYAVRPIHGGRGGIQNFSIFYNNHVMDEGSEALHRRLPCWGTEGLRYYTAAVSTAKATNRSAYLWDAGLWTACWESRMVMMDSFEMSHWNETRRHLDEYWEGVTWYYATELGRRERSEFAVPTTAPALQHGGEDWELVVRPSHDAFKLDLASLETLLPRSHYDHHWGSLQLDNIFQDLPFSSIFRGCALVRNIILEFDSSWNRDWPEREDDFCELANELSPRGFVANLITEIVENKSDYFIWLIDRGKHQSIHEGGEQKIFYDLDSEFVETMPEHDEYWHEEQSAAYFIRKLNQLGEDHWTLSYNPDFELDADPWRYCLIERIGILGYRGE
ncbi:hypothetical protein B0T10DRAFT_574542 [Thelonectria olida]|uniref:2EXR domain-containing protein n=1 Tax=Thelonectria olida TaxID=1576542 RepID=A0A9P9AN27_9HYPO|nr:hypothetical protein B0T10DRAFT_574542 [Thelonectria olida]